MVIKDAVPIKSWLEGVSELSPLQLSGASPMPLNHPSLPSTSLIPLHRHLPPLLGLVAPLFTPILAILVATMWWPSLSWTGVTVHEDYLETLHLKGQHFVAVLAPMGEYGHMHVMCLIVNPLWDQDRDEVVLCHYLFLQRMDFVLENLNGTQIGCCYDSQVGSPHLCGQSLCVVCQPLSVEDAKNTYHLSMQAMKL